MNRRNMLASLAALPFMGWVKLNGKTFGYVDVKRAQQLGIHPCRVYDANGRELKDCLSFNDETGECKCHLRNERGDKYLASHCPPTIASTTVMAPLPLSIVRMQ